MTLRQNSAEGGNPGATVTSSDGGSGDALTNINIGSNSTLTYSNTQAAHGAQSYNITCAADRVGYVGFNGLSSSSMAARIYLWIPNAPAAATEALTIRSASARVCAIAISASGKMTVLNAAGTSLSTSSLVLPTATWIRFELTAVVDTTSTGQISAAYYQADSTTPLETAFTSSTANLGTALITEVRMGRAAAATQTDTWYLDDVAANDGSSTPIGPYAAGTAGSGRTGGALSVRSSGIIEQYTVRNRRYSVPSSSGVRAASIDRVKADLTRLRSRVFNGFAGSAHPALLNAVFGTGYDRPQLSGRFLIAGIVRDANSNPYSGALVSLFRITDNILIASTVSASDGSYSFVREAGDAASHYVAAWTPSTDSNVLESVTQRGITASSIVSVPDAPTALRAQPGKTSATLFWSAPVFVGSSPVNSYRITNTTTGTVTDTGTTATSATLSGLTANTVYSFTVQAASTQGLSAATAAVSVRPSTFADSFYRPDTTVGLGTLDTGESWTSWVAGTNPLSVGLLNQRAVSTLGTARTQGGWVESNLADVVVRGTLLHGNTNEGLVVRMAADTNSMLLVIAQSSNTFVVNYYNRSTDANFSTVGTSGTVAPVNGLYALTVVAVGSALTVYANGAQILALTTTSNQSATRHGMWLYTPTGATSAVSNFSVNAATASTTDTAR